MLLKLSNKIYRIAFKLKSYSLYLELKFYIKNRETYVKQISRLDRNIGKTYNLIKLSIQRNIPIAVGTNHRAECIRMQAQTEFNKNVKVIVITDNSNSFGCTDKSNTFGRFDLLLCEEGFDSWELNEIRSHTKCLIGYYNNDTN